MVKKRKPAQDLIDALTFIKQLYHKKDNPFCTMRGANLISDYNGISINFPVEYGCGLQCHAHADQLLKALKVTPSDFSIQRCGENGVVLWCDEFELHIECDTPQTHIEPVKQHPDVVVNNGIRDACKLLYPLPDVTNTNNIKAYVHLDQNLALGSDGVKLIEYFHGCTIPHVSIPPKAAEIVGKCKFDLVGFGFNDTYCTFYFETGLTVTTKYINCDYFSADRFFKTENAVSIPEGFFKLVKTLKPFLNKEKHIVFDNGKCFSELASIPVPSMLKGRYNYNFLMHFEKFEEFAVYDNRIEFFSGNARGILAGISESEQP